MFRISNKLAALSTVVSWSTYIKQFKNYLKLERSLAQNSIDAYLADISKFQRFLDLKELSVPPTSVEQHHLVDFLEFVGEMGSVAVSPLLVASNGLTWLSACVPIVARGRGQRRQGDTWLSGTLQVWTMRSPLAVDWVEGRHDRGQRQQEYDSVSCEGGDSSQFANQPDFLKRGTPSVSMARW